MYIFLYLLLMVPQSVLLVLYIRQIKQSAKSIQDVFANIMPGQNSPGKHHE